MKFWQELRRRRVYRLAGLYILGAWVVIQVADISFPAWGVPETALRFLFVAAIACFPIALIFSWFYDITPKGIVRTEAADGSEAVDLRLKRGDYLVLAALLAVGFAILFGSVDRIQEEVESGPVSSHGAVVRENSIAVLPFANLDIKQNTAYFSDGITEEILNRLSSLKALHVLASNSSFAFRDSKESLTQIREKLGVRYILQGSIRRENDYVRVTARLIDEGGFQVWSEQFDRKLEGIFAIQTEVASKVVGEIINEIVPLQELPAGRTTKNMAAYNEYLAGKAFLDARGEGWKDMAITAFQKAIELDAGFAPPYAGLAMATTVNTHWGSNWEEGRQLASKAIALDAELAEGHAALGMILMADGKLQQASLSLRHALELNASMGFAYNILAVTLGRLGLVEEAMTVSNNGLAVDPLNPPLVMNVAGYESREGNFERAEQLLRRLLSLPHPPPAAFEVLYFLYDNWGRFPDAIASAKQHIRRYPADLENWGLTALTWGYGNLGMNEDADYWMSLALENGKVDLSTLDLAYNLLRLRAADSVLGKQLLQLVNQSVFQVGKDYPWTLAQFGLVNIQTRNFAKGVELLDLGLRLYQAGPDQAEPVSTIDVSALDGNWGDILWVMHQLAFAYQQVGEDAKADDILKALEDEADLQSNALHHALKGDEAGALKAMQSINTSGRHDYYGPGKYYEIINDPAWAGTIKAPEFQQLLAEMKEDIDRQRAIVEAIDAEHDFRAEVEHLIAK